MRYALCVATVLSIAMLACGGLSTAPAPLPGAELPPIPTDAPPTVETVPPTRQPGPSTADAPVEVASPLPPTNSAAELPLEQEQFVWVDRDDRGFGLWVRPGWLVDERTNGVVFYYPGDQRVWIGVFREQYTYSQGMVDERVSELRLEAIQELDPDAFFYEPYRSGIGMIRNGRASDYVYRLQGVMIYGSVTVGTTLDNVTWVVQWEAPAQVYPDVVEDFVYQLTEIELKG